MTQSVRHAARILDQLLHNGVLGSDPEVTTLMDDLIRFAHDEGHGMDDTQLIEHLTSENARKDAVIAALQAQLRECDARIRSAGRGIPRVRQLEDENERLRNRLTAAKWHLAPFGVVEEGAAA